MKKRNVIIPVISIVCVLAAAFVYHVYTPFMMDDLWYATNLSTGEPLTGLKDVFESGVWHYLNWGGRSITHALLQLIIMGGEFFADILNTLATLLLAYVIADFIDDKKRRLGFIALSLSMLVAFNPSLQYSMFWQAGCVNYVYSTIWILAFIKVFLRSIDLSKKDLPLVFIWIVPLGLITGWSNENMGPASFLLSLLVILYRKIVQKEKFKVWMILGSAFSLIGSALCLLAPGNFVRSEYISNTGLFKTILDRLYSMLEGGAGFLLPAFLVLALLIAIRIVLLEQRVSPQEWILLITMMAAYGAMILSPHFPARSCFGILSLAIILINNQLSRILNAHPKFRKYAYILLGLVTLYAVDILFISALV